jgi:hypothetical protein
MTDWVKKALTRTLTQKGLRRGTPVLVEPNPKLVLLVKFSFVVIGCLVALETANLAFLHSWNSEVFAAISGLIGTVTGVLIGHHS